MNLAWLAAVLSPFEIAPHPNFGASSGYRPEADLARIVQGDSPSWDAIERRIGVDIAGEDETVDEGVRGVFDALYNGLNSPGARLLLQQLNGLSSMDDDLARRTALTLLVCFVAGSNDQYDQCELLINHALQALGETTDPESSLCRAALLQQLALRKSDGGEDPEGDSLAAATLLEGIDTASIDDFPLNGVTTLAPQDVAERIRVALVRATWSTIALEPFDPNGRGPIPSRRDQLFSAKSDRYYQIRNAELVEYRRLVERAFDDAFRNQPQTRMGYRQPDIFFELLAQELYGDAGTFGVRQQLAMMRLTNAFPSLADINVSDCLLLFRQSGTESELRMLVAHLIQSGPLGAVVTDARRILEHRSRPSAIRVVELVVLEAAADLVTTAEANAVLDLVFRVLESGGPPNLPKRWQIESKRFETTFDAAIAFGNASGSIGRVAEYIVESMTANTLTDQLWDRAYARAARQIEWENVPRDIIERWRNKLTVKDSSELIAARVLAELVPKELSPPQVPSEPSLSAYVDVLNWYLRQNLPVPDELFEPIASLAVRALDAVRSDASRGRYAHSSVNAAEILAVLILQKNDGSYWPQLLDFLCDERVPRSAKERPLNLLASRQLAINDAVRAEYGPAIKRVINAVDPWAYLTSGDSGSFAAFARFAAVYDFLEATTQFDFVCALAASVDRKDRLDASRTIRALAFKRELPWLEPLALQLSFDAHAEVRAEAARSLSSLLSGSGGDDSLVLRRLLQLLDSDGVTLPLTVLQNIPDGREGDSLREKALTLRVGHISRKIREAAALAAPA